MFLIIQGKNIESVNLRVYQTAKQPLPRTIFVYCNALVSQHEAVCQFILRAQYPPLGDYRGPGLLPLQLVPHLGGCLPIGIAVAFCEIGGS